MQKSEEAFIHVVTEFYTEHGRHTLPWRKTQNPYRILVSEIMLQQTQVERVIPKYQAFLKRFPTVESLAAASLGEVLVLWQGLGYNRRAKMLHTCAQVMVNDLCGQWPQTHSGLVALPGIGPYTASAVLAFAFNIPTTLIETNVRTVYLHHFFPNDTDVPDSALLPIIERTLDTKNPRAWYAALMDYGSHLKATVGNKSRASKHHVKQSTFAGSNRQIRGAIIRTLGKDGAQTFKMLQTELKEFEAERVQEQLASLTNEGMIIKVGQKYSLPT
jgi:A/G-specific adenine glycosylase